MLTAKESKLDFIFLLDLKREKGYGFLSPGERTALSQFILFFNNLGGVPVFNLPVENPNRRKHSVRPTAEDSPILPALNEWSPI